MPSAKEQKYSSGILGLKGQGCRKQKD